MAKSEQLRTVRNLNNVIISLYKDYNPEMIGIFGSFARNKEAHSAYTSLFALLFMQSSQELNIFQYAYNQ